jgi:energy-coupling factor transporter transmembrane protein EcfT
LNNNSWLLSEDKTAKLISLFALVLWSVLTLGTVLVFMFYVMVLVPLFNWVPQNKVGYSVLNEGPVLFGTSQVNLYADSN